MDLILGARGKFLRACVLLVLAEGTRHGYELAGELAARGYGEPDAGGLYRALHAMEREGLIRSTWEAGYGPSRRVYAITDEGLDALDDLAAAARNAARCLDRLLHYNRRMPQDRGVGVPG